MKSWKPVAVIVVLFLCACTPRYTVVTPELRTQMMADLKAGKPNLTCDLECVFSWTSNFRRMIALHNASQWEALAELVMQVGHGKDISYYFLGKAAEGLGYYDAAAKYYHYSFELCNGRNKLYQCRAVKTGNYCGGLDLAATLPQLIGSVQAQGKTQGGVLTQVGGQSSGIDRSDPAPAILENTPAPGCQTTFAVSHSGGAHCCSTAHISITCGSANYVYEIYYGNSGATPAVLEDVDGDGVKELDLADEAFVYYTADARHSLSYAESVKLTRYAVWTSQGWRVTAPGELRMAYLKLKNQALTERVKGQFEAANAIEVTYYALMCGEDAQKTRKQLEDLLPRDWKSITNKVFKDLQSSVSRTPIDPDSKKSVITTIRKTDALNKRGGVNAVAPS